MEVNVKARSLRFSQIVLLPDGSTTQDLLERFEQQKGVCSQDFYVTCAGVLTSSDDLLRDGHVYHLETRLRGGKGGFGSMLRALGAQIEKTTNREACRDLSGRRLRDVNHEKEMADWLKKQAEREAEKEQRRAERLQRKLSEPKHMFADPQYQQQCHDMSERLEESVLKGLQASSSTQVKVSDVGATKRPSSLRSEPTPQKKKKKMAAACFWTGVGELQSSEEDDDDDDDNGEAGEEESSTSSCEGVATTAQKGEEPKPESSSSPSPPENGADQVPTQTRASEEAGPASPSQQCPASPSSATSAEQLEALGLDALKEALMSRGVKCGGTLSERAARLFAVRGLSPDQIDPALLAKPTKSHNK